jgi:copper chaperone NosL
MKSAVLTSFVVAAAGLAGCNPSPRPLQYGVAECDHCRMTLSDERYGGEIVTRTGKIYTFDSVECLAAFSHLGPVTAGEIHDSYVIDYGSPRTLVRAADALFLKSTQLLSPMGANLTAFRRDQDARGARDVFGGDLLTWEDARRFVESEWVNREPSSQEPGS